MAPDSATYNNQNRKVTVGIDYPGQKCQNKTQHDKGSSDIYINSQSETAKVQDEDEENVYSEIKTKNFKRIDPLSDEHGYSFIRMDCANELARKEICEDGMPLYSPLREYNNDISNNELENVSNSKQTDAKTEQHRNDSFIQSNRSTISSFQNDTGDKETRDDTCDSGIYTSINLDSDKDDETSSESMYDKPKNKTELDEKKQEFKQVGSEYYENCRRNSDENNYDIPRSQKKGEEDAIYSDIARSSEGTNNSVVARISWFKTSSVF